MKHRHWKRYFAAVSVPFLFWNKKVRANIGGVAMGKKRYVVCQSCGKSVVYAECSERCAPPEDARCKVLTGWLSVSCWKGMGAVDYHDFCSLVCLQRWVDNKVPRIPESFLKAFKDE